MKKILFVTFLSICFFQAFPAHIKGGFFTYEYLGKGINNPTYNRYKITLNVYMVCNPSSGQLTNPITFTIFKANTSTLVDNPPVAITRQFDLAKLTDDPCITGNQAICYYTVVVYELNNYELPETPDGYTISYQRCCRIPNMLNISGSGSVGNTYAINIPGTNSLAIDAPKNSSPNFPINDTAVVCNGSYFSYPFSVIDKDGDALTYSMCAAYEGGSIGVAAPNPAAPPPYVPVNYNSGYSGGFPLGSAVTIDPNSGLISGIAPSISGEFVITVCVAEYRAGIFLGESRKELHMQVQDCIPAQAKLNPKAVTCDGFSLDFSNATPLQTGTIYSWDFGDGASGINNTSTLSNPTHIYSDTGVYKVVLNVALGGVCQSKDSITVKVYPGFFPDFSTTGPSCKGQPVQFLDKTTTKYGAPTGWRWDFGNLAATNDSSQLKNPLYTYPLPGSYNVRLIVGNTFGCIDTIIKPVVIADNPIISLLSKDTSYCGLDTLQLTATGTGNFTWTPNNNTILNPNTATPSVFPTSPTVYTVALNLAGCISRDSVKVSPTNNLTNTISASSVNICESDTITLTANSNYTTNLSWSWSPANTVSDPLLKVSKAYPLTNTTYTLTTTLGRNCVSTTSQLITVKALAKADAGPDTYICFGQTTTQLNASGGNSYQWVPATGLSNANIPNPIAAPTTTTTYKVLVGTAGCTALRPDTVQVLVRQIPPITLTNDTLICTIDTLQLVAAGNGNFVWSPNINISNLTVASPLVSPDVPIQYFTTLTDPFGCKNRDSVFVDVKAFVTINAGNDTTICRTDGILINTVSDALSYQWSPALYLDNDKVKRPLATPLISTITYTVVGNIGKCQSSDQVTIQTVPYPQVTISPDTTICFGDSAPLVSGGGSIYAWSPSTFLTSTSISNPTSIKPTSDIRYTVAVKDVLGCPKSVSANVWVRVFPIIKADAGPHDTSVVIGQPLLLSGTGATNYLWTPPTWLSNPNIANPTSMPEDDILYRLKVTNVAGCSGIDSIFVKVYKVPPSFYVPTAFSPNNDNRNDIIKPILLGMRSLKHFRVFNRWGQVVFATSMQGKGWDGTFKGNPQDAGTYVWMAEGETYTGQVIKKQGTVVLLR